MSTSRQLRTLRGLAAAVVATFTALFSHVVGGGDAPGPLGVLAPLVMSVLICTAFAGRRLSLLRVSLSVGASQLLFHSLFQLGASGPASIGGHAQHLATVDVSEIATAAASHATMQLSHAVAAVVTIAVLHRGETLLLAVAQTTAHAATRFAPLVLLAVPAPAPAPARAFELRDILPVAAGASPDTSPRRGPPAPPAS